MSSLATVVPGLVSATDNPVADFSDTPWWLSLVKAVLVFVYLMLSVVVVIWAERRVIGRMQQRPGPNRNGPFGLLQTLADGMKSMLKEDVRPMAADALMQPESRDAWFRLLGDGWTAITKDRKLSAQWEHTVLVTADGYEILTLRSDDTLVAAIRSYAPGDRVNVTYSYQGQSKTVQVTLSELSTPN